MPRRAKGPRLHFDSSRSQWVIRDGERYIRTPAGDGEREQAEKYLAQYLSRKHKPASSNNPLIADVLAIYADEVAPRKKSSRNLAYQIGGPLLSWWGDKLVSDISPRTCRAYADTRPKMAAQADIKILKWAVTYWHSEYGPLDHSPSFWKPKNNPPKTRWLTRQEAARLLRAAKPYPYLRRFILLGLYTGSRPGVLLALRWHQVDLQGGVLYRSTATQDAKKRAPPVRVGRRILAHLRRWHRQDIADGRSMDGYVCHNDGRVFVDPHTSWRKTVAAAGLQGITRHTLRHTRATWLMQKGIDPWEAAGHLGMTVRTLESVYGHHSPDHQEDAANV